MKEERKTEGVNQYLKFSGMGIQMAVTIALFAWLGTFWIKNGNRQAIMDGWLIFAGSFCRIIFDVEAITEK